MAVPIRRDEERHNRCGFLVQSGGNGSGDGLRRAVDTLIEMVLMHAEKRERSLKAVA